MALPLTSSNRKLSVEDIQRQLLRKTSLPFHTRIWLDQDPGCDDAVCQFQCLFDSKIEVKGLTITNGNVNATKGLRNAKVLLALFNSQDVPLYLGSETSQTQYSPGQSDAEGFHGEEGLPKSIIESIPPENLVDEVGRGINLSLIHI